VRKHFLHGRVNDKGNSDIVTGETTSAFPRADCFDEPDAIPTVGPVSLVDGLPKGSALLVVKRGPNAGSRFLLDQPVTSAGRHRGSDIFLDDVTVSRRHAEFRWENDEFQVVDVGSLYGTYVNREAVHSAVLVDGDEVQIGKFRLVFLTGAQDRRRNHQPPPVPTGFRLSRFRDNGSGLDRG
jgi:pSer/pThr/pTyr-binding forkhead associated (FHA) protein